MHDAVEQAIELRKAGDLNGAEAILRQALASRRNDSRLPHLLGVILLQQRRFPEAATWLKQAATAAPDVAEVHFALGDALRFAGDAIGAATAYQRSIALRPLFPPAHNALGLALIQQNKIDAAILAWQHAIHLKNDYAEAYTNLGAALGQQKKYREAADVLARAVELNPRFAPAHNNLANVLNELKETTPAMSHWQKALELHPGYFDALINLAKAEQHEGQYDAASEHLERAIAINQDNPDARFLRGLNRLSRGDLAGGFADYRFRLKCPELNLQARTFAQPEWDGGELSGKTILLHIEQGLGDAIQFIRYAPLLAERGATVIVESAEELTALFRSVPGVHDVISRGNELPTFDVHASVMNLPLLFGTTLETIPRNIPYIFPSADRIAEWARTLAGDPPGSRVGIVWSGNPKHANDRRRSIPLRELEAILSIPSAVIYSLQKGLASGQLKESNRSGRIIDHTARLTDFQETAAMIHHLDSIVTVDTSVAHLAGAMGKRVLLMLPRVADWRWMIRRDDSPWYPTMRLIRQKDDAGWETIVRDVANALNCDA